MCKTQMHEWERRLSSPCHSLAISIQPLLKRGWSENGALTWSLDLTLLKIKIFFLPWNMFFRLLI